MVITNGVICMKTNIVLAMSVAAFLGGASTALAQTASSVSVQVSSPSSVAAGSAVRVATITMTTSSASSSAVTLTQLPLSVGFSNTGMSMQSCRLQNSSGGQVSNLFSFIGSQITNAIFNNPLSINTTTLSLICDIPVSTPNNSAAAVSIPVSLVMASSTTSSVSVTSPSLFDGVTTGGIMSISSPAPSAPIGTSTTPGTPNTGAGGSAQTIWSTLVAAMLLMLCGSVYLIRRHS